MIVILFQLAWVYFIIGLLGFGGGYVLISMIHHEVVQRYAWISEAQFTDIVAISQMTPGPIGINSATYIGYTALESYGAWAGVLGSLVATISVMLPSLVLVLMVCYLYDLFRHNRYFDALFRALMPVMVGMIGYVVILLITPATFVDAWSYVLFVAAVIASYFFKAHPMVMILGGAAAGVLIYGL